MTDQRFIVKATHGMCMGTGMFVVFDTQLMKEIGTHYFWRDEAELVAKRLEWQATHGITKGGEAKLKEKNT
jgi:predicted membrane-bound dolichyl-phosphate-mannose-protein mannosyltransferase